MSDPSVSLVLPAFNAAARLGPNVERSVAYFRERGLDGEVVVVDDGSTDGTADQASTDPTVRLLRLPHRGKGGALRAGMLAARGELRAFTDVDLPFGLAPLDEAIALLRSGAAHAVVGDRTLPESRYSSSQVRRTLSQLASVAFRGIAGSGVRDTQCGFKAFRGDVAAELFRLARTDGFAIDIEVLFLLRRYGLVVAPIPVQLEGEGGADTTVHLVRDSAAAARDVAAVRLRWALGRYRSAALARVAGP